MVFQLKIALNEKKMYFIFEFYSQYMKKRKMIKSTRKSNSFSM